MTGTLCGVLGNIGCNSLDPALTGNCRAAHATCCDLIAACDPAGEECRANLFAVLPPPAEVTVTVLDSTHIEIAWTAVPGAISYEIYEEILDGNDVIYLVLADKTSYTVMGVGPGEERCYAVRVQNYAPNESQWMSGGCVTTPSDD